MTKWHPLCDSTLIPNGRGSLGPRPFGIKAYYKLDHKVIRTFFDNIFDHFKKFLSIVMTWFLTSKDHHIALSGLLPISRIVFDTRVLDHYHRTLRALPHSVLCFDCLGWDCSEDVLNQFLVWWFRKGTYNLLTPFEVWANYCSSTEVHARWGSPPCVLQKKIWDLNSRAYFVWVQVEV